MVTLCLSAGVPMITAATSAAAPRAATTTLRPGQRDVLDGLASDDAWLDLYDVAKAALRLRREHPALRQRHHLEGGPTVPGGPKDLAWVHPEGREMTEADWYDDRLHTFGMFVSGDPLRARGPHGEQLHDSSFLLWFHAHAEPGQGQAPANQWVRWARWCSAPTAAPGRLDGLGRRGHRHRAALGDRAPPAVSLSAAGA